MKAALRFCSFLVLMLSSFFAAAQVAPPDEPIGGWYAANSGVDRGRYYCQLCNIDPAGLPPLDQTLAFLKETINNSLNACCKIWKAGDTFTVCNGQQCTTYTYQSGQWISTNGRFPDNGNYYGDKATLRHWWSQEQNNSQCGYGGVAQMISGHYEWNDYYSDDVYIGSGDLTYVTDSTTSLNRSCV